MAQLFEHYKLPLVTNCLITIEQPQIDRFARYCKRHTRGDRPSVRLVPEILKIHRSDEKAIHFDYTPYLLGELIKSVPRRSFTWTKLLAANARFLSLNEYSRGTFVTILFFTITSVLLRSVFAKKVNCKWNSGKNSKYPSAFNGRTKIVTRLHDCPNCPMWRFHRFLENEISLGNSRLIFLFNNARGYC